MSVSHKPYIIFEIEEIKKAEAKHKGRTFMRNPDLDMFRITAVLKSYVEKTQQGFKILDKIGLGSKMDDLNKEYLSTAEAFTASVPVTSKSIEWNRYHVGGEIMIAYYPTEVWASFHTKDEPDNDDEKPDVEVTA